MWLCLTFCGQLGEGRLAAARERRRAACLRGCWHRPAQGSSVSLDGNQKKCENEALSALTLPI